MIGPIEWSAFADNAAMRRRLPACQRGATGLYHRHNLYIVR
jgi:hypothetical protein